MRRFGREFESWSQYELYDVNRDGMFEEEEYDRCRVSAVKKAEGLGATSRPR